MKQHAEPLDLKFLGVILWIIKAENQLFDSGELMFTLLFIDLCNPSLYYHYSFYAKSLCCFIAQKA